MFIQIYVLYALFICFIHIQKRSFTRHVIRNRRCLKCSTLQESSNQVIKNQVNFWNMNPNEEEILFLLETPTDFRPHKI
jgi:hypothetical protein